MKLKKDIKEEVTKELLEELSEDDYREAENLTHFCLEC